MHRPAVESEGPSGDSFTAIAEKPPPDGITRVPIRRGGVILNAGCGPAQVDGWLNVDDDPSWHPDVVADLRCLPFADGTFAGVASNHCLQTFPYREVVPVLSELRRVTRRGGVLRLVLPDWQKQMSNAGLMDLIPDADALTFDGKRCLLLTWRGESRSLFAASWVRELLGRAGWMKVALLRAGLSAHLYELTRADSRPLESLFVEAIA